MDTPTPDQIDQTPIRDTEIVSDVTPTPEEKAPAIAPEPTLNAEPTQEEAVAALEAKLSTAHAKLFEARNQIQTSAMNGHGPSQAWLATNP